MAGIKSSLRSYQDRAANTGWRIRLIPFDDPTKPMRFENNWLGLLGAVLFVGGCVLYFRNHNLQYLYLALGGLALAPAGIFLAAKLKRLGWQKTEAVCMDREIQKIFNGQGYSWGFRILCQLDYAGKKYSVTPAFWRSFGSENAVTNFLAAKIHGDGRCFLYVNPRNPLQADFAAEDIAEKLLH